MGQLYFILSLRVNQYGSSTRITGMKNRWALSLLCLILILTSCPLSEEFTAENFFLAKDRESPRLLSIESVSRTKVEALFSESVHSPTAFAEVSTPLISHAEGDRVLITLEEILIPGSLRTISLKVSDRAGNTTSIKAEVTGVNKHIPEIQIHEFTTQGTKSNPDRVELKVLSDGDLAGMALYDGMFLNHTSLFVFNPYPVKKGDYIVVQYMNPENLHEHEHFFYAGENGLGGNNGVISLYLSVGRRLIDAVSYSNRTSLSDSEYGGFGTEDVYREVKELSQSGFWRPVTITPESCVRSDHTTSTRSMNREEDSPDTDTAAQWYTVPTGSSSFGGANCPERYSP